MSLPRSVIVKLLPRREFSRVMWRAMSLCVVGLVLGGSPAIRHVFAQETPSAAAAPAAESSALAAPPKVTYDEHILPIFRQHCGSCHNAGDKKGGLTLDLYKDMLLGGSSGDVFQAGAPGDSYLFMVVNHDSEPFMPPNQPKIPAEQIALLRTWIELGMPENAGSKVKVPKKSALDSVEFKGGRPEGAPAMPVSISLETPQATARPNSVTALATSPWAPLAAISGFQQILLYDTRTLDLLGILPFPEGDVHVLKFSRDGTVLLAGGGRGGAAGNVIVFDVANGARLIELGGEYDSVLGADLTADRGQIVLGGPKRMVRLFNTASGELQFEIKKHTDWLLTAEYSPDGVLCATGDRSSGLVLWESSTGQQYLDLLGHKGAVTDVSWRADSNLLASGSEDGTVKLWELNEGKVVRSIDAHAGGVTAIEFTRDGNLVTAGRDRLVRLFSLDGKELKKFTGLGEQALEVAYCAESNRVLAGDWSGNVQVWSAESGESVGTLSVNPPTIAARIPVLQELHTKCEAQVAAAAAALSAIEMELARRLAKTEQAVAARMASQADMDGLVTAHTAAMAASEQQSAAVTQAEQAVAAAQAALEQAKVAAAESKAQVEKLSAQVETARKKLAQLDQAVAVATAAQAPTAEERQQQTAQQAARDAAASEVRRLADQLHKLQSAPVSP